MHVEEIQSLHSCMSLYIFEWRWHIIVVSEQKSILHLSFPLKLAQVPWGHKGDGFKLIITSIHYRGSWIYS